MPAVAGGTGFVGFGDYENANQEATSRLAGQVEAANPNLAADQAAVSSDTSNVASEVAPWLADQQKSALSNDQNAPDPTANNVGNAWAHLNPLSSGGSLASSASPSLYAGETPTQAAYNQAETGLSPNATLRPTGGTDNGAAQGAFAANQADKATLA